MDKTAREDHPVPPSPPSAARIRTSRTVGLILALILTPLFWWPSVASALLPEPLIWRNIAAKLVDWVVALLLVALVIWGERAKLSSLGFKKLTAENFAAGLGLGGFFMVGLILFKLMLSPLFESTTASGAPPAELSMGFMLFYAPFALVTASLCEEVIFRGYAMERLLRIFKNPWPALLLPHSAFALMHLKDGLESVAMVFLVGSLFTYYYYRYRDLTMVIIAHALVDTLAIVGAVTGQN